MKNQKHIVLSNEAFDHFIDYCNNKDKPNKALKSAVDYVIAKNKEAFKALETL